MPTWRLIAHVSYHYQREKPLTTFIFLSVRSIVQPGMKRDMGGAAAILAAFQAAVKCRIAASAENETLLRRGCRTLHAILCLAENSVDSTATRPDDVHTLYSGRTVRCAAVVSRDMNSRAITLFDIRRYSTLAEEVLVGVVAPTAEVDSAWWCCCTC